MDRFCQHLAHIVYKPGSEYDLELVSRDEYSLDQIHILDSLHIRFIIISENQSQAGRAVCDPEDIIPAPGKPDQF